ncbi:unnamed protein product [Angiostrongylus costaricensis]|uniref:Tnp_DNA_bind domain-containing protein n=1 Tax=Angiostrongylus costaricensis TaxID=334426 RepID=A0A0R3Q0Q2_ANGCS|nr:unnamed protein product [Angiostrongylus costaricensis]
MRLVLSVEAIKVFEKYAAAETLPSPEEGEAAEVTAFANEQILQRKEKLVRFVDDQLDNVWLDWVSKPDYRHRKAQKIFRKIIGNTILAVSFRYYNS